MPELGLRGKETSRARRDHDAPNRLGYSGDLSSAKRMALAGQAGESSQELADIAEVKLSLERCDETEKLLRLKETNPEEFEKYTQMAADATRLAEEHPDAFAQLLADHESRDMDDDGTAKEGARDPRSAARTEQLRAMKAASQMCDSSRRKDDLKLPPPSGGNKTKTGGFSQQQQGIMISPDPAFVIKTRLLESGVKVFINVCQHEKIGESGLVKKLDEHGDEVEGLNVPMSVGPPSLDKDKAGTECVVYDVVINPKAVEQCKADRTGATRDWVCHLALQSVMAKHKCNLDQKYKLPKLTFKGDKGIGPAQQRIRDDSARPQIEEVASTTSTCVSKSSPSSKGPSPASASASWTASSSSSSDMGTRTKPGAGSLGQRVGSPRNTPLTVLQPRVLAVWIRAIGCEEEEEVEREQDMRDLSLEDTVRFPREQWPHALVVTIAGLRPENILPEQLDKKVELRTSAFEYLVKAYGHQDLQARLPYAVVPNRTSACVNSHEGTLVVTLTLDKACPTARPDPGSKPWLLAHALDSGDDAAPESGIDAPTEQEGERDTKGDDALPEDRFHLRLPQEVTPYTGDHERTEMEDVTASMADGPVREDDRLPEERFHRADIISQHMVESQEQQRKEKIERAEAERQERKKMGQEGVEYMDIDDFRSGAKFGPAVATTSAEPIEEDAFCNLSEETRQCMDAAARVLKDTLMDVPDSAEKAKVSRLSSSLWSELLD